MQGFTTLQNTKNNIKQAIMDRGVFIQDSDTFASYAQKISNIRTQEDTPAEQTKLQSIINKSVTSIDIDDAIFIGNYVFSNCASLATANFPYATSVGGYAFYNCPNLTTADFPYVTSVGDFAFYNCAITTVNFPYATSIGSGTFSNCQRMSSVNIPNVTSIGSSTGSHTFGNTNLTTANFPNVTSLMGSSTFNNCQNLTSANFPNATTPIGNYTFNNCKNLTSANFSSATSINAYAFWNCARLVTTDFSNVTTISANAFRACPEVAVLNFPSATYIGNYTFNDCDSLIRLQLGANQVCTLESTLAFSYWSGEYGLRSVYVPPSLVDSYKANSNWVSAFSSSRIRPIPDSSQLKTLTINNNISGATYSYVVNGEASSVTGKTLSNVPRYSTIEYVIRADGFKIATGTVILEDNATVDVTMVSGSWHTFTQPQLDDSYTFGGNSFAVGGPHYGSGSGKSRVDCPAFFAFDGEPNSYFMPAIGSNRLVFYNPNLLAVSRIVLTYFDSTYSDVGTIKLYGSDDYVTWTLIQSYGVSQAASQTLNVTSGSDPGYLYHKIEFTRVGRAIELTECTITAQEFY